MVCGSASTVNPVYSVGQIVWLSTEHLCTDKPAHKLDFQFLGPFKIPWQVNLVTFELQLLFSLKISTVFHVSFLKSYTENPFPQRTQPSPLLLQV